MTTTPLMETLTINRTSCEACNFCTCCEPLTKFYQVRQHRSRPRSPTTTMKMGGDIMPIELVPTGELHEAFVQRDAC